MIRRLRGRRRRGPAPSTSSSAFVKAAQPNHFDETAKRGIPRLAVSALKTTGLAGMLLPVISAISGLGGRRLGHRRIFCGWRCRASAIRSIRVDDSGMMRRAAAVFRQESMFRRRQTHPDLYTPYLALVALVGSCKAT